MSLKQISAVLDRCLQDNREFPFKRYLLVKHLADGLELLVSVSVSVCVAEEVDYLLVRQLPCRLNQVKEILRHIREFLVSRDLACPHKLVHHQVGRIVNYNARHLRPPEKLGYVIVIIRVHARKFLPEGQRLAGDVDYSHLVLAEIAERSAFPCPALSDNHCYDCHCFLLFLFKY